MTLPLNLTWSKIDAKIRRGGFMFFVKLVVKSECPPLTHRAKENIMCYNVDLLTDITFKAFKTHFKSKTHMLSTNSKRLL
jgi:hypothetical protein